MCFFYVYIYQKESKVECMPTFEQISQQAILEEANRNIAVMNALEAVVQDRSNAYNSFLNNAGKSTIHSEIFQLAQGSTRHALDSLYVYIEQELQQARQYSSLSNIKKSVMDTRMTAARHLTDYQREVADMQKEVSISEKKLSKSKEQLERAIEQRRK